jgi:6-phosphogluconate dehydrogenase (decarboxylating)
MSIGIIGTTTQTLKISNKVQKVNKVHTYDVSHAVNLFNAQNYACVADLMVNMDRPRTVFTSSPKSVPQILAWSDPEDTVIHCTLDHFDRSLFYENQCSEKSVHYLSASLTNDAFLVGGKKRVFSTHEPLILRVRQKRSTRRGYAGVRPFRQNGSRRVSSVSCFQSIGDAFAYCKRKYSGHAFTHG